MTYALGMLIGPPLIGIGLDIAPSGFFLTIAVAIGLYLLAASLWFAPRMETRKNER